MSTPQKTRMKDLIVSTCVLLCISYSNAALSFTTSTASSTPLRCRRCIGATELSDCIYSITCTQTEMCYMDMVVNEQLQVVYNGGCRAKELCHGGSGSLGKRAGQKVICSGCCDTIQQLHSECNVRTCGLPQGLATNQCYHCETNSGSGSSAVMDPQQCTTLVSCSSHQMCGAETFRMSTREMYEFKCIQTSICTLLTRLALERMDECRKDPSLCPTVVGKRETSGTKVCTACCGDNSCNNVSCDDIMARLYALWQAGVLDLNTLRINGTTPGSG